MLKSLFTPKVMVVEVTRGLDLEHRVYLTDNRVTVGSATTDSLQISDQQTVSEQLVFEKGDGEKKWSFYTNDSADALNSLGNTRAGTVKNGLVFSLSPYTQVTVRNIPMPDELKAAQAATKKEVPLSVALPGLTAIGFVFLFVSGSIGAVPTDTAPNLRTEGWYNAPALFSRALEPCLETARNMSTARLVPKASDEAPFQIWLAAARQGSSEKAALAPLRQQIGRVIVDAQLSIQQGAYSDAIARLQDIERHLPVSAKGCPVNAAIQSDISKLNARF